VGVCEGLSIDKVSYFLCFECSLLRVVHNSDAHDIIWLSLCNKQYEDVSGTNRVFKQPAESFKRTCTMCAYGAESHDRL
jgi:hypothetical protein